MEDSQESHSGSETLGIGGHFQKSFGYGSEQNPVDDARVLQSQWRQFARQGENHMTIRNGQNLLGPVGKPLVARSAVALRAMPVATRPVFNHLVRAVVALLYVCAERSRAARADIPENLLLLGRQHISPALEEFLTVLAEDIGDFQPMFRHRRRPSLE